MIFPHVAESLWQIPEFWSAIQAISAVASVGAATAAVFAANKSHRESGPMISVAMNPFLYAPKNRLSDYKIELGGKYEVNRIGTPQIEMVLITVTNYGRTAATVNNIYLEIDCEGVIPKFRQTAREIAGPENLQTVTFSQGPIVIEPYSEKRVLIDFWGRMRMVFEENPGLRRVAVSGAVDVVGMKENIVTAKHGQWYVMRGHRSFSGNHCCLRPIDVMATELTLQFNSFAVTDMLIDQMQSAERQLQPNYSFAELTSALEPWPVNKRGPLLKDSSSMDIGEASIRIQNKIEKLRNLGCLLEPPKKIDVVEWRAGA